MPWPWPWPRRMTIWPAQRGWECIDCANRYWQNRYWQICSHCGQSRPWWEWPAPHDVQWLAPHNVVEAPQRLSPERQEWLARENVAGGVIWQRPSPARATESSASRGGGQAPPASGGDGEAPLEDPCAEPPSPGYRLPTPKELDLNPLMRAGVPIPATPRCLMAARATASSASGEGGQAPPDRPNPWVDYPPEDDIPGPPMRWGSAPEGIRADPDATYRLIDYLPELAAKQMSCTEGLAYHQVRLPKLHEDLQYCMLQILSLALLNQVIEWACGQGHRHTTLPHALEEAEGRALITHADARWIRHINRMGNRAKHEPAHSARSRSPHSRGRRR